MSLHLCAKYIVLHIILWSFGLGMFLAPCIHFLIDRLRYILSSPVFSFSACCGAGEIIMSNTQVFKILICTGKDSNVSFL